LLYPRLSRPQKDLFRIGEGELRAFKSILGGEPTLGLADVDGEPLGSHAIGAAGKYIALQHHRKAVVPGRIQCRTIRRLPAIKRLADPAHPPRHRKIAHTHFAHVVVHIPAEPIEQALAELANRPCFTLQTPQIISNRPLTVSGTP
jgi:hypothetical protein